MAFYAEHDSMMADQLHSDFDFIRYTCGIQSRKETNSITSEQTPNCSSYSQPDNSNSKSTTTRAIQRQFCNMLTTPKLCEWLKHEWLYSSIDREIFLDFNDFQLILREHFPTLKTRCLTRSQWSIIRRIIGRPRRFSANFLSEERRNVQGKRRNIQHLQHLVLTSSLGPMASEQLDSLLTYLPSTVHIPLRLPVGTKVCINFYIPVQGLYLGIIQDSCPGDGHYTVWIEELLLSNGLMSASRARLQLKSSDFCGLRIVPEEDIYPLPGQGLASPISVSEIRYHFKENMIETNAAVFSSDYTTLDPYHNTRLDNVVNSRPDLDNQSLSSSAGPLLSESICTAECPMEVNNGANIAVDSFLVSHGKPENSPPHNYSSESLTHETIDEQAHTKFLINLAKVFNILERKRSSVETLRQLNDTAEVKIAENRNNITVQFQHSYATLILHMDKLNQELKHYMDQILSYVVILTNTNPYLLFGYGEVYSNVPIDPSNPDCGHMTVIPGSINAPNGVMVENFDFCSSEGDRIHPLVYRQLYPSQANSFTTMNEGASSSVPGVEEIAQERNMLDLNYITDWRRRCDDEAQEMVSRIKNSQMRTFLNEANLDLVAKLSSLLIHLCNLSEHRYLGQGLACIDDLLKEIRSCLHPNNLKCFEVSVEHFIGQIVNALTNVTHSRMTSYPMMPNYRNSENLSNV